MKWCLYFWHITFCAICCAAVAMDTNEVPLYPLINAHLLENDSPRITPRMSVWADHDALIYPFVSAALVCHEKDIWYKCNGLWEIFPAQTYASRLRLLIERVKEAYEKGMQTTPLQDMLITFVNTEDLPDRRQCVWLFSRDFIESISSINKEIAESKRSKNYQAPQWHSEHEKWHKAVLKLREDVVLAAALETVWPCAYYMSMVDKIREKRRKYCSTILSGDHVSIAAILRNTKKDDIHIKQLYNTADSLIQTHNGS